MFTQHGGVVYVNDDGGGGEATFTSCSIAGNIAVSFLYSFVFSG